MALLIKNAHILSMDPAVPDGLGHILIEGDRLASIVPADAPIEETGAEVIDAKGMIALPGFVDTHRHFWQTAARHTSVGWDLFAYIENFNMRIAGLMRAEDVYIANLLGAIGAIDSGITLARDESHAMNTPEHADAAIQGLRESGIRARFAYGWPCDDAMRWMFETKEVHPEDMRRVRNEVLSDDDALVTLNAHLRGPLMTSQEITGKDLELARDLGIRSSMHVGSGDMDKQVHSVTLLKEWGLIGPDITFAHLCTSSDEELKMVADAGASASVCAFIEATMPGIGDPATGRLIAAGVRPTFGVDVEVAASGDLFSVIRAALASHNLLAAHDSDYAARTGSLTPSDLLEYATIDGARALGLDHVTGSLTPGKKADVVLIDGTAPNMVPLTDPAGAIVAAADVSTVRTVIIDGKVVKRDGKLVGVDMAAIAERAAQSRDHLLKDAAASGEGGRDAVARLTERLS